MKKYQAVLILILLSCHCLAQPDPNKIQVVSGISVWSDVRDASKFYYAPGKLSLASDADGKPMMKLMLIRYTGNSINKDEGQHRMRSILQFRIKQQPIAGGQLNALKQQLHATTLNPLPVFKTSFVIALPSLSSWDTTTAVNGFYEKDEQEKPGSYWTERDFTLRLDDYTAQFVKAQLDSNRLLMYCSYTFYHQTYVLPDTTGFTGTQTSNVPSAGVAIPAGEKFTQTARLIPFATDAFGIDADTKKWNDIVAMIDINAGLPPAYPCLDVYCYDFLNNLTDTLYEKSIRIKAMGIAGDPVYYTIRFNRRNTDVYAATVRLKYAVRLDLPFSYQLTSINNEGDQFTQPWVSESDWSRMIDITARNN